VEIWNQTGGRVTHFVAGIGTGGTIMGTGRRLRVYNQNVKIIGVQPAHPFHGIEGLKHIESSIKPAIFNEDLLDRTIFVETEDAYEWARKLVRKEAVFAGQSSGAVLWACIKLARELTEKGEKAVIVTVFPDGGERYLTTALFEER